MSDPQVDDERARKLADEEADRLRRAAPAPALTREQFLARRSPRYATAHAMRLDNPLWHWLVWTRNGASQANKIFDGPSPIKAGSMWCFDRFGTSETEHTRFR